MRLPAHQVTTANLGSAYPFMASRTLNCTGSLIGRDLLGGAFYFDPFELYTKEQVSNTNVLVFGQIGRGKSALVKSFLWRQSVLGRQAWIVDPKGEYNSLARLWGVSPIKISRSSSVCLNPLDSRAGLSKDSQRSQFLATLGSACLGRPLSPTEHASAQLALEGATQKVTTRQITISDVVNQLLEPSPTSARSINTDVFTLAQMGRDLGLELRRLVVGDLQGMFDGQTSEEIDMRQSLVIIDLSDLYESSALGIVMSCCLSWLNSLIETQDNVKRYIVVDEAWAVLRDLSIARWLQASWKLSRSRGLSNIAILHRVSDLLAAGSQGSEQVAIASGLLSDSETRIIYSQPPGEVDLSRQLLGLNSTEAELLIDLRRGRSLWKVGTRSFVVSHQLGSRERGLVDTDQRLR